MNKRRGTRFGRFGVLPLVVVLGVLAAACGSGSSGTAAKAPAGAKENATTTAVCTDLYKAGVQVPCTVNTVGPGGGVVFYDAGSPQSWGRFLEVAPWNWGPADQPEWCLGGCGYDPQSVLGPIDWKTEDRSNVGMTGTVVIDRITLCNNSDQEFKNLTTAANTGEAIGEGAAASTALLADPACARTAEFRGAVQLADVYRGGGLDDWYLPSKDELYALCKFTNRNAVGGFNANGWYASSSTVSSDWTAWRVGFDNCGTDSTKVMTKARGNVFMSVRPIRAFS
jgi:hypothetical protein